MKSTSHASTEVGGEQIKIFDGAPLQAQSEIKTIFFYKDDPLLVCNLFLLPYTQTYAVGTHNAGQKKLRN